MKKKLIIAFIVFTAIGLGIFYVLTTGNVGTKYNTVAVQRGEVGKSVQDVGRISSRNIRRYYGNGTNKVEKMTLTLGDYVKKGQLLLEYENTMDLEIQKVEKQIQALEATYKNAQSGTDMESISSARIEVSKIRSELESTTKDKERTEALYAVGAVSFVEFEQAVSDVDELQRNLAIAQNTYNKLAKGLSANLREKYEAEIDVLALTLEILEQNKAQSVIYADVDGIVTEVNTFEGDSPSPGSLMIEIQDPAEKVVLVDFMVDDAINVKSGLEAKIMDFNLDIDIDNLKVNQVYPKAFVMLSELSVEENRQTVEIGLPKSAEALAFGVEVETRVMVEAPREVLVVPSGAVFQKDSKQHVKVLEGGALVEREIITGIRSDGKIEVKEGLVEGELVLLNYEED